MYSAFSVNQRSTCRFLRILPLRSYHLEVSVVTSIVYIHKDFCKYLKSKCILNLKFLATYYSFKVLIIFVSFKCKFMIKLFLHYFSMQIKT